MILFIQKLMIKPIMSPSIGPPNAILIKLPTTPKNVADSPFAKLRKRVKKTIAVPSLSRDYPSTRVLNLTLAPSYFRRATTATGSVAESTHPKVRASYQES